MSNEKRRVDDSANDFFQAESVKDYQARARQSWEAFAAQLQKQFGPGADDFFKSSSTKSASSNVTIDHALAGLKSYADWMQNAAASVSTPQNDWRQQMQQLFGGASQPFSHGFAATDGASIKSHVEQWQAWLESMQKPASPERKAHDATAGFGFGNEQHAQQQMLADAIRQHLEASQRYQLLIQRSNAHALEKMQTRLTQLAEPGHQIESLKVLYDLWVDCAEEAYAEIALSDEFREAYGQMVNTQIRVRQLQQEQAEYLCQQLGIPTRSDVASLGERLQSLRREVRSAKATVPANNDAEAIAELRREIAALRQQLSASHVQVAASRENTPAAPAEKIKRSAVKTPVGKSASGKSATKKSASASKLPVEPAAKSRARKRK